ncbi:MAG TPA: hypothetical protein VFV38_09355 [Ktedonobacteraceae bacterium]|nr:hypothetical protein [Ktedonobacteraceae bacterium]
MPQSIRQVLGKIGHGVAGITMLGALLITGGMSHANAVQHHASHPLTASPPSVASLAISTQHSTGSILTAFQSSARPHTVLGGAPPAGMPQRTEEGTDLNTIEFNGTTMGRVGADNMLHLMVGSTSWHFLIPARANLREVGGSPQAIHARQHVEVTVRVIGNRMVVTEVEPGD